MILAVFFPTDVSLENWIDTGWFDREKVIYEKYLAEGLLTGVVWFTYGKNDGELAEHLQYQKKLDSRLNVISLPAVFDSPFGRMVYSFLLPLIQWKVLKNVDLLKTHQINGSWSAVFVKFLYNKPLIVRCGHVSSLLLIHKRQKIQRKKGDDLAEQFAFKNANHIFVPSRDACEYVMERYGTEAYDITILPNYVDTGQFKHMFHQDFHRDHFVYVGRLAEEKNIFNLIQAAADAEIVLHVYGEGPLLQELEYLVSKANAHVIFHGVVPHAELPALLNHYKYFILPSVYEGMPKALLEAMACGLICLGTNVPSINEIIQDQVNGFLIDGTEYDHILTAIERAQNVEATHIGQNAIKTIEEQFSLEKISQQEAEIITKLAKENRLL